MYTALTHLTTFIVCLLGLIMAIGLKTQANEIYDSKDTRQEAPTNHFSTLPFVGKSLSSRTGYTYDVQKDLQEGFTTESVFEPNVFRKNGVRSTRRSLSVSGFFDSQSGVFVDRHQNVAFFQQEQNSQKKIRDDGKKMSKDMGSSYLTVLPISFVRYDIPFFSQAPYGDWSEPRANACEEASIVLAYYGILGRTLSRHTFAHEVARIIERERAVFDGAKSISLAQVKRVFTEYFSYENVDIASVFSPNDVKKELADGNLVIAGFAGRKLGNPYYYGQGPLYHMMVIVGYEEDYFIVHDVGTRHGAYYRYQERVLFDALHDYVSGDITTGPKNILVVRPKKA